MGWWAWVMSDLLTRMSCWVFRALIRGAGLPRARSVLPANLTWCNGHIPVGARRLALYLWLIVAVAGALSACGNGSHSSPSPVNGAPIMKTFRSTALGISFHYPSTWHRVPGERGNRTGDGALLSGATGGVGVVVVYDRSYRYDQTRHRPGPFANAGVTDLRRLEVEASPKRQRAQLISLGGLRLALVEFVESPPSSAVVHEVWCASAISTQTKSSVRIAVFCPRAQWTAERETMMAILDSVRFSQPGGTATPPQR
jgi:hypothetical protein